MDHKRGPSSFITFLILGCQFHEARGLQKWDYLTLRHQTTSEDVLKPNITSQPYFKNTITLYKAFQISLYYVIQISTLL